MATQAERLHSLFMGLERAHGVYEVSATVAQAGAKQAGRAHTVREPVSLDLWKLHLEGTKGLGIIPINDSSACKFGVIDIDQYSLNLPTFLSKIRDSGFKLVPCRSKSGGLHLYTFLVDWVPAAILQAKLKEIAAAIGYGTAEIFPKQTEILAERGDVGQWINMPYFAGDNGMRYALDVDGNAIKLDDFLDLIEKTRITQRELESIHIKLSDELPDGPPCLQHLIKTGFPSGTRNDGLFNLGVYARKAFPDEWEKKVEEFNHKFMHPPLSSNEVQAVIKSLKKKDYGYCCSKPPIQPHCNSGLCRLRKHGIGAATGMPVLSTLTKLNTNPPTWFIDVESGGRLELSTDDLQNQPRFQKRCMDCLNVMPPIVNRVAWQSMVQQLLAQVNVVDIPVDASPKGQLTELLEKFCTGRAQAKSQDELLLGKPWSNDGRTHFRMQDLMSFLDRHKFYDFKIHQVASHLKQFGAQHHFFNLKGKGTNCWSVPDFTIHSGDFETPKQEESRPF